MHTEISKRWHHLMYFPVRYEVEALDWVAAIDQDHLVLREKYDGVPYLVPVATYASVPRYGQPLDDAAVTDEESRPPSPTPTIRRGWKSLLNFVCHRRPRSKNVTQCSEAGDGRGGWQQCEKPQACGIRRGHHFVLAITGGAERVVQVLVKGSRHSEESARICDGWQTLQGLRAQAPPRAR